MYRIELQWVRFVWIFCFQLGRHKCGNQKALKERSNLEILHERTCYPSSIYYIVVLYHKINLKVFVPTPVHCAKVQSNLLLHPQKAIVIQKCFKKPPVSSEDEILKFHTKGSVAYNSIYCIAYHPPRQIMSEKGNH